MSVSGDKRRLFDWCSGGSVELPGRFSVNDAICVTGDLILSVGEFDVPRRNCINSEDEEEIFSSFEDIAVVAAVEAITAV
jgi:hypothetical protein